MKTGSPGGSLFNYQPFISSTHIRLLHLDPGTDADPLRCSIIQVDLNEKPNFTAISYMWGPPEKPFRMLVEDSHFIPLTASLDVLLKDVRHSDQRGPFWADQICINQSDPDGRSQQVVLMGRIYEDATQVITYIGPEGPDDKAGFDLALIYYDFYAKYMKYEDGLESWKHSEEDLTSLSNSLPSGNNVS